MCLHRKPKRLNLTLLLQSPNLKLHMQVLAPAIILMPHSRACLALAAARVHARKEGGAVLAPAIILMPHSRACRVRTAMPVAGAQALSVQTVPRVDVQGVARIAPAPRQFCPKVQRALCRQAHQGAAVKAAVAEVDAAVVALALQVQVAVSLAAVDVHAVARQRVLSVVKAASRLAAANRVEQSEKSGRHKHLPCSRAWKFPVVTARPSSAYVQERP